MVQQRLEGQSYQAGGAKHFGPNQAPQPRYRLNKHRKTLKISRIKRRMNGRRSRVPDVSLQADFDSAGAALWGACPFGENPETGEVPCLSNNTARPKSQFYLLNVEEREI